MSRDRETYLPAKFNVVEHYRVKPCISKLSNGQSIGLTIFKTTRYEQTYAGNASNLFHGLNTDWNLQKPVVV